MLGWVNWVSLLILPGSDRLVVDHSLAACKGTVCWSLSWCTTACAVCWMISNLQCSQRWWIDLLCADLSIPSTPLRWVISLFELALSVLLEFHRKWENIIGTWPLADWEPIKFATLSWPGWLKISSSYFSLLISFLVCSILQDPFALEEIGNDYWLPFSYHCTDDWVFFLSVCFFMQFSLWTY